MPRDLHLTPRRTTRRWCALLAAVCLLAGAAGAGGSEREVREILRRLDARAPQSVESTARALSALGPKSMPELFGLIGGSADAPADQALARAFAWLPAADVRGFIEATFTPTLAPERRGAALRVLEEAGGAGDLARACDLASAPDWEPSPRLADALEGILRRVPAAVPGAVPLALQHPPHVAEALIGALAELHTRESARALLELGGQAPVLASSAYSHLGAAARSIPRPTDAAFLERLRELLSDEDPAGAEELLMLAGRFEDDEAVPLLIARLSATQAGMRSGSAWALRRITGFDLGKEGEAWSAWFAEESRWWSRRSTAVLAALRGEQPAAQCEALRELGQRFWRRQRVADELVAYLGAGGAGPAGAAMACGILGRLRCESARAALEARSSDPAPEVRAAAAAALQSLDGKIVPTRSVALSRRRAAGGER